MATAPILLGHRGARAVRSVPENTIVSFDLALEHGCDGVEFDLQVDPQGMFFCSLPNPSSVEDRLLRADTLDKLKAACTAGTVAALKGFGAKTQSKILEGLAFIGSTGQRIRLDQALEIALPLLEAMRKHSALFPRGE